MAEKPAATDEPRWHASLAVLLIVVMYITLPPRMTFGPLWLFPVLILAVLVPLSILSPNRGNESDLARYASVTLIAVSTLFNIISLVLLIATLLGARHHHAITGGEQLLTAGVQIWVTNLLVFGLWYWELDAGGPESRANAPQAIEFSRADFEFPQMIPGQDSLPCAQKNWKPLLFDYLYLAFNTATALSPCDTFPMTRMAKALMMAESAVSFVTIAIIISRSINILS